MRIRTFYSDSSFLPRRWRRGLRSPAASSAASSRAAAVLSAARATSAEKCGNRSRLNIVVWHGHHGHHTTNGRNVYFCLVPPALASHRANPPTAARQRQGASFAPFSWTRLVARRLTPLLFFSRCHPSLRTIIFAEFVFALSPRAYRGNRLVPPNPCTVAMSAGEIGRPATHRVSAPRRGPWRPWRGAQLGPWRRPPRVRHTTAEQRPSPNCPCGSATPGPRHGLGWRRLSRP